MSDTMRAYRLVDWQQPPRMVEVPVPEPGPGQVLVKVAANSLCHSDIGMGQMPGEIGTAIGWAMPFTLGHETSGWVARLGEGVAGVGVGDAVALVSPTSCGSCRYCLRGLHSACRNGLAGRGYGRDGGLADYVLVDDLRALVPLGDLDPVAAAPLTDAGATAYHAVSRAVPHLTAGSTAVVLGAGGLGSFAVQFLRALTPARVIAVDQHEHRLEFARELGAHETVTGIDDATPGRLRELTNGEGADAVLDFVGIDESIACGVRALAPGGAFGLIGASGGSLRAPWYGTLPADGEVYTFQGSTISDLHAVIALTRSGQVRSEVDRFSFDEVEHAYRLLDEGALRGRAAIVINAAP